jgi:hypothetical protein
MEQMLSGLEKTSSHLALTLNMPPVDVAGLRREWETLLAEFQSIPPSRLPALPRLERTWADLKASARDQNRTILAMSSLMAVSTLSHVSGNLLWLSKAARLAARRTSETVGGALLDHYTEALQEIAGTGFLNYWKREFRPYLRAAAAQFAPGRESLTERLMRGRK